MKVKDISEYPFVEWVYNYMEDVYFIETESSIEARENIDNIINGLFDKTTMLNIDTLINAIECEQYTAGFLKGYIAAVRIMRGQTIFRQQ